MCNLTYLLCFVGIERGIESVSVEALISVWLKNVKGNEIERYFLFL